MGQYGFREINFARLTSEGVGEGEGNSGVVASLLLLVYLLLLAILLLLSLCSFQKSNILDYRTTTIGQVIFSVIGLSFIGPLT